MATVRDDHPGGDAAADRALWPRRGGAAGGLLFIAGQTGIDETHQIVDRRPEGAGGTGVPQYQGRVRGRRRLA